MAQVHSRTRSLIWWYEEVMCPATLAAGLLALLIRWIPLYVQMLGDAEYAQMAIAPGAPVGHLHRYRVLVPAIVRWLPCDLVTGFRVVTYSSTFMVSLLVGRICRAIGLSPKRALIGIPMYLLTWPTLANFYQPRLVDPLAWVFVAAGLLLILRGHARAAILVGGIGALAKEMVIPIIPLAIWALLRERPRPSFMKLGVTLFAAALPYAWVLATIPGNVSSGGGVGNVLHYLVTRPGVQLDQVGSLRTLLYLFFPYGALWVLAPLGLPRIPCATRRILVAWIICTAPFILMGAPERMLEVQAPALLPLAACGLLAASPLLSALIVVANGLFITRIATIAVPFWAAWGSLGFALACSLWLWYRAFKEGFMRPPHAWQ